MAVWQPLVVCDGVPGNGLPECDFATFILLIKNLITDLVVISTLIAVAVFCYAGFILLTSGGNKSAMDKAKGMLGKVVVGYLWILAAWLIVYTITSVLLNTGYSLLGNPTRN